ncbi:zinc finger C2H2-type domain protein [Acidianus hospitalis W1]|uniref:Zinc finger C2H2-type domain protein n=1 Tax=Acidianus hospitalis (strain W1) TaxID=933801 RepID=F4B6C3_ACIHW|nr:zinc finger C2H2-type domain protein [Acidianus hospitalis W1]
MAKRVLLKCELCGQVFASNSLYYQHKVLQHSDYKPIVKEDGYECPICHEKRKRLEPMLTHMGLQHLINNPIRIEIVQ